VERRTWAGDRLVEVRQSALVGEHARLRVALPRESLS
jgi:hypothetical protein